ncbi:restriction endonuclease subunit S [Gordonia westfalica]|uniref:Type I restriction enzyme, S subunit n=1 Tax=Gordonia westfalica TaxID=158898 RepID=A0A1H2LJP9_9ACTN|nr:restriction endonuclease subunit S [Gordonia westfalica]SDU80811.1 type I restriction enzyme, S subunit [Gordonia westfalica]
MSAHPTTQLRRLARIRNGADYKEVEDPEGEYPVYGSGGIFSRASRYLYEGPSVLLGRKGTIDKPLLVDGEYWTVDTMFCAQPAVGVDPRFLYYVCTTIPFGMLSTNTALPSMSQGDLNAVMLPRPQESEQVRIADFLDRETAKIDALIAKQEQLIATLQEDRIATITHAVTRGLDSEQTVPAESAWVGRRPRTWTETKMKYLIDSVESGTSVNGADTSPAADELGVLKTSAVSTGSFVPTASKTVVGEDVQRLSCPVRAGTLLVNRANSPRFVGSAAYVDYAPENLYLSDKIWQFDLRGAAAEFVHLWTLTPGYRSQIQSGIVGTSSSMQNVSMADYRELALAVPDLVEQRSIVNAVRARVGVIINLVNKSTESIATLREYRSALITDAVTGKIDVREMV